MECMISTGFYEHSYGVVKIWIYTSAQSKSSSCFLLSTLAGANAQFTKR